MAAATTEAGSTRGRAAVAGAFACLAAALVAIGAAAPADAVKPKEIGKTGRTPPPSCPTPNNEPFPERKGCEVLGKVTAFQKFADGKKGVMRVPKDGHIVAWAVALSKPNKGERNFFDNNLGGDPSARLALVSRTDNKQKYRLRAQSKNEKLNPLLGRRQYFTLNDPIPVTEDWIAAVTTKSWAPNFAHHLRNPEDDNVWKASRPNGRCTKRNDLLNHSRPHEGIGSTRTYACTYRAARLIYWAYFRPS